jgi:F-type H+-transporting ATPase subunit alpha
VKLSLAQYRELAAFAQFASDLDDGTRKQLDRGKRVTELMKQAQYSPLSVGEMALSLYAANEGYLDDVDEKKIVDFEAALMAFANDKYADFINDVSAKGDYNDEIAGGLKKILDDFKATGAY